ncbi:MAG TPA: hypothetical protein VML01_02420 [Bryobacterales bacterium]|nr:hypothetical protein [Bryobacterales bacterium]
MPSTFSNRSDAPLGRVRLLAFALSVAAVALAQGASEPKLLSVFPAGGAPGTETVVSVRGTALEGADAVWFDRAGVSAEVAGFEVEAPDEPGDAGRPKAKKGDAIHGVNLKVAVAASAEPGVYRFRLVTPRGVSDELLYRVSSARVVNEAEKTSGEQTGGLLNSFPVAVNGRISAKGEVDDYEIDVKAGEELVFEASAGTAVMDPTLTLFERTGSWLNADRLTRLAYSNEPIHFPGYASDARLTYRFDRAGRYVLRVASFLGPGSEDHVYQLRVTPSSQDTLNGLHRTRFRPASEPIALWEERSYTREIGRDRMDVLWARSVKPDAADSAGEKAEGEKTDLSLFEGAIPVTQLDTGGGEKHVTLPALIEGAIESAGNVDRVTFDAKLGDQVALEIETPDATVPDFNPFLKIVDETGVEVFTNVHSNLNNNGGFIMKTIQPKTVFTFRRDGKFTLEIRDITTQEADDRFQYRVLLRPQVPHMGAVHVAERHLNLIAGEAKKISITTDQEEGFDGYIALTAEGLPSGVQAIMATEPLVEEPPPLDNGKIERYVAKNQLATMLFAAEAGAPATKLPSNVRIMARPVRNGKMGNAILVKELLVMVTRPAETVSRAASPNPRADR